MIVAKQIEKIETDFKDHHAILETMVIEKVLLNACMAKHLQQVFLRLC